jgi:hypothetical protein
MDNYSESAHRRRNSLSAYFSDVMFLFCAGKAERGFFIPAQNPAIKRRRTHEKMYRIGCLPGGRVNGSNGLFQ